MSTYWFLQTVAKEHSTPYDKLLMGVSEVFTRSERLNLDPDCEYMANTEHFNCFVREHKFKEVNIGTVVLYLKGVKLAVSNQIISDLSIHLEDANKRQNQKISLIKGVLITTLAGFSYLL